ncbi:hypothetical protein GGR51DRAFT_145807 [Nemania sp. FL0031]|nr:hypothetical protein GGR51DRAFT_145807 [Nemania sp. FL0031]
MLILSHFILSRLSSYKGMLAAVVVGQKCEPLLMGFLYPVLPNMFILFSSAVFLLHLAGRLWPIRRFA